MPLGIETNNLAPQLIQGNGQALVQGIRQIGQQISGHLTEIQTKRDLASLGQEAQGLNVESNEFPTQLAQLVTRHPLAARDERGLMALSAMGKAHGQWQATEAEARAFNRAMALQGMRERASATRAEAATTARNSKPISIYGVGLVDPLTKETLVPEGKREGSAMPFASTPNGVLDKRTGALSPLPAAAAKPMTEYQRSQIRRAERKDKISAINQEINQFDSDIASAVRQYESSFSREEKASDPAEKARHQADKTEVGKIADKLKAEKAKRLELLKSLRADDEKDAAVAVDESVVEPELGLVPPGAVAAPAAAPSDVVLVIDPNGVPGKVKASQLEAALQNGYKRR